MSKPGGNMPAPDRCPAELAPLLSLLLDGQLSAAQQDKLQTLLRESQDCRRYYLRFMNVHAATQWVLGEAKPQQQAIAIDPQDDSYLDTFSNLEDTSAYALAELARLHDEGLKQPVRLRMRRKRQAPHQLTDLGVVRRIPRRVLVTGSLAAAIAIAGLSVLIVSLFSQPEQAFVEDLPEQGSAVATLTAVQDARWQAASVAAAPSIGDPLYPGQELVLVQGFAEITTRRDTVAILEAPATIELLDYDNALHLHAGKLVGLCHTEASKGFVVKTDHADITDLGTEFAVDVRPGGLDATVFVGAIALKTPDAPSKTITHNQTARVTIEDDEPTLAVEDGVIDRFVRRTPQKPLVTAAYINDARFTVQVANQSLFEDAKIHTDRNHEINGIDADGLPLELLGADIVLTPANARPNIASGTEGLQIEIETSRPAQVYLLFAKGRDVPAWMGRDYVKTNLQAGIDYAKSDISPKAALGVGPGQSVNGHQDIWRRKQPVDGRALVGKHMPKYSAYVILAVPIPPSSSTLK